MEYVLVNPVRLMLPADHKQENLISKKTKSELACKSKVIYRIMWRPPRFPWIKVNTDGASKGNPGPAACGGVFRDFRGCYLGGFCMNLGLRDALYAELMAIIIAVHFAAKRGWSYLWLESDSTHALSFLLNESYEPAEELREKWCSCKSTIKKMGFHCTHIFREGNVVADMMANEGLSCSSLLWWNLPPHEDMQHRLLEDMHGVPKYRIRN